MSEIETEIQRESDDFDTQLTKSIEVENDEEVIVVEEIEPDSNNEEGDMNFFSHISEMTYLVNMTENYDISLMHPPQEIILITSNEEPRIQVSPDSQIWPRSISQETAKKSQKNQAKN